MYFSGILVTLLLGFGVAQVSQKWHLWQGRPGLVHLAVEPWISAQCSWCHWKGLVVLNSWSHRCEWVSGLGKAFQESKCLTWSSKTLSFSERGSCASSIKCSVAWRDKIAAWQAALCCSQCRFPARVAPPCVHSLQHKATCPVPGCAVACLTMLLSQFGVGLGF